MKKLGFMIIFCLIFTGCATMKMVERWPQDAISPWVKGAPPSGCFRGIAINVSNEKKGWHTALEDVKKQVCSSIGFETREEYEKRVTAYNDQVDKKIIADFRYTSAALLEDINSSIKDTYFERWMQKTNYGKKYFCNYYVLVHYPQARINEMKYKTEQGNEKRLRSLEKSFAFAEEQANKGEYVKALRTYIYALFIADTLFVNSELRALECIYKIASLITSLRLIAMKNYFERPGSLNKVSVRLMMDGMPAEGVPVRFENRSGTGRVEPLVISSKAGIANSAVQMTSIRADNEIRAFVDLSHILSIDERLLPFNEVKQVSFIFSTLSEIANVQGGTLYVDKKKESWFKKTHILKFDLREVNGLGAAFDRYDLEVKGLFKHKHWLTGRVDSWSRSEVGSFNLSDRIKIKRKGRIEGVLEWNIWLIDTFKAISKEKYCREIQLTLTLFGKDYNGNLCRAIVQSTPMPVNPH